VAGTLVAALLNLADLVSARWCSAIGCVGAAIANALVTTAPSPVEAVAWRFATGTALALVYPPGIEDRRRLVQRAARGRAWNPRRLADAGKALPYCSRRSSGGPGVR